MPSSPLPAGVVQLPRTSVRRGATTSLTLLRRVNLDPFASGCMCWEGPQYLPGYLLPETHLYAGCQAGGVPLVLENTEVEDTRAKTKRRRFALALILWRWDQAHRQWFEAARVVDPHLVGTLDFREFAARLLCQDAWREDESIDSAAGRLDDYLTSEIRQLGDKGVPVLDLLLGRIVSRLVAHHGWIPDLAEIAKPSKKGVKSATSPPAVRRAGA